MAFSNFLLTLISGLAGTIVMTIAMYLYGSVVHTDTRVVHILGAMITCRTAQSPLRQKKVLITGSVAHTAVGVLFSLMYFLLWNWGIFDITFFDSIIVGAFSGILAVGVWKMYFVLHRNPPEISLPHYFAALFISHIVFGAITVNIFSIITDEPQFWYKMKQRVSEVFIHLFIA